MLKDKFADYEMVLASKSPRRRQLLQSLDIDFVTKSIEVEETYPSGLQKQEITEFLCEKKMKAYDHWLDHQLLLVSDTIVWHNNQAYEKPKDRAEAIKMLRDLAHQTHEVITSVGIYTKEKHKIISDITQVTFGPLSEAEITYYVDTYQPYDKAGAYGIQEWIGYIGITEIVGSYYNVMGLPVQKLYQALKAF